MKILPTLPVLIPPLAQAGPPPPLTGQACCRYGDSETRLQARQTARRMALRNAMETM